MTTTDTVIRAAGAVLWREHDGQLQVAVVHRPRYDDWSLPKGKLDDGETAPAAAVREIREETGFRAALGRRLGRVDYVVRSPLAKQRGPKVVDYWAARAGTGSFSPNDEVDELRWLAPDAAARLVSRDLDRDVLDAFTASPLPTATVLLLRHAWAGERESWDADDELRPLSEDGRQQAEQLCRLLGLFGPTRVYSAPKVRCVQTVAPLAAELGIDIEHEPLLGDERYSADPDAGLERLLRIADRGGPGDTVVMCSQGDVIPAVVRSLAGSAALDENGEIPRGKGSTWVLSLRGRQLVAADYYGPP